MLFLLLLLCFREIKGPKFIQLVTCEERGLKLVRIRFKPVVCLRQADRATYSNSEDSTQNLPCKETSYELIGILDV